MSRAPQARPLADGAALARLAGHLADPTRATVLLALLDGRAWTLSELAAQAGVGRPTLSDHASRLVAAGLLAEERQGRHRYLRLADDATAALVEALAGHAGPGEAPAGLRDVRASAALAAGRTCFDHLAGRLGVGLLDALVARGHATRGDGLALTSSGTAWLGSLGVDVDALRRARRPLVRPCLDWTERRWHLAGSAGAALLDVSLARGWVVRREGSRAVALTDAGERALRAGIGFVGA